MKKTLRNIPVIVLCSIVVLFPLQYLISFYLENFANVETVERYGSHQQIINRMKEDNGGPFGMYDVHRYIGYIHTPNYRGLHLGKPEKINSLSYRGEEIKQPKPKGEFRIVCFGGSSTFTYFVRYNQAYPYLLEENLRERVTM